MATGVSVARADNHLADHDTCFVQLHTADPGAAGTTAVSAQAPARKAVTFGAPSTVAGHRQRANTAIVRWDGADVGGTEAITHWSLWSASTAGTFLQSGALDATLDLAAAVPAEIPVGGIVVKAGPVAA